MEWEATFSNEAWLAIAASKAPIRIEMEIGKARHTATLPPIR
jgi:hypothetical protein